MTFQEFRAILKQQPFKPFRILMSNGKSYEVRHPKLAWLTQSVVLVGVGENDDGIPDDSRMCSLENITAVEPLDAASLDLQYTGNPS